MTSLDEIRKSIEDLQYDENEKRKQAELLLARADAIHHVRIQLSCECDRIARNLEELGGQK